MPYNSALLPQRVFGPVRVKRNFFSWFATLNTKSVPIHLLVDVFQVPGIFGHCLEVIAGLREQLLIRFIVLGQQGFVLAPILIELGQQVGLNSASAVHTGPAFDDAPMVARPCPVG